MIVLAISHLIKKIYNFCLVNLLFFKPMKILKDYRATEFNSSAYICFFTHTHFFFNSYIYFPMSFEHITIQRITCQIYFLWTNQLKDRYKSLYYNICMQEKLLQYTTRVAPTPITYKQNNNKLVELINKIFILFCGMVFPSIFPTMWNMSISARFSRFKDNFTV